MKNVACALLLLAGCGSAAVTDAPVAAPEPFVPYTVVAVVDKIEAHGMQDLITNGSVISWTVVTFLVADDPLKMPYTVVKAYCSGHPFLDTRPLLIGEPVTFKIPPPVQRDMIPLEQLEELQRMRR